MNNLASQDLRIRPVLCVTRGLGTAVGRITGDTEHHYLEKNIE